MKPSDKCFELIKQFEGCKLKAYKDSAGIWTIGWGTTYYPETGKVQSGETITQERADFLLRWQILDKATYVDQMVKSVSLNQNQFDALVSFAYNAGAAALKKSTLLKKVLSNPNDPSIEQEFLKWDKAKVKGVLTVLNGLTKRRQAEADLYFS